MREKSKYAGKTVKIRNNVGRGTQGDLAGMDFVVEKLDCLDTCFM